MAGYGDAEGGQPPRSAPDPASAGVSKPSGRPCPGYRGYGSGGAGVASIPAATGAGVATACTLRDFRRRCNKPAQVNHGSGGAGSLRYSPPGLRFLWGRRVASIRAAFGGAASIALQAEGWRQLASAGRRRRRPAQVGTRPGYRGAVPVRVASIRAARHSPTGPKGGDGLALCGVSAAEAVYQMPTQVGLVLGIRGAVPEVRGGFDTR